MHRLRIAALGTLALAAFSSLASAAPHTLTIDRGHSEVGFNVRHFFTKFHGSFSDFVGTIVYDPENLVASSVEVTIKDSSIYTAHENRDKHLRGEDFFWHEKYPHITFKSTKVIPGADAKHFKVAGDLTIRDVTKPVTLDVEVLGIAEQTVQGRGGMRAGFEAKTKVDRKDYGIVWNRTIDQGGVMLGDEVELVLNVEAFTRPPAAAATTPAPEKTAEKTTDKTKASDKK